MSNNRLFKMLYYILEHGKVTASELADKFEVSVRTIYRDIDVISSAGIPIYALRGKDGGIEIDPDFILRQSLLSEHEQTQIMSAIHSLQALGSLNDDDLIAKLSALFKVKNPRWIEVDFTNWQNNPTFEVLFNQLKSTIINKQIISFDYFSLNQTKTNRTVKPVRLVFKGQDWYLYGYCLLRNDFRFFKLARIKQLQISTTHFSDDFSQLVITKDTSNESMIDVQLMFTNNVRFRVYDEMFTNIIEDDDGNFWVNTTFPNHQFLINYLLSYGEDVEIIQPQSLRNEIKAKIEKMGAIYHS